MNQDTTGNDFDVAIVGYGPVGATLANLLGQEGLKVAVFEREKSVYHQPRASHLDGETMRVYQSASLSKEIDEITIGAKGYDYINAEGQLLLKLRRDEGRGPQGWDHHYRFYQPALELTLRKGVERFDQVRVFLQNEVLNIVEAENHAVLKVLDKEEGTVRKFSAAYVVGCDGARSLVRSIMGTPMEDLGLHQPWLVIDIKLKRPVDLPINGIQFCNPKRPITYVPQIGSYDRYRWEIRVLPGEAKEDMERPERIWDLLSPWVKPEDAELERASVYIFHALLAQGWRKGRMILAGDAAHMTPPFLGQGMCAGVRDVANLAWKLKLVIQNKVSDALLDSYEAERSPNVREYIQMAVELGEIIATLDPISAAERDQRMLEAPQSLTEPVPPLGRGLHGNAPAPAGTLFPQPELDNGMKLDDAIGLRFAVIGYSAVIESAPLEAKKLWETIGAAVLFAEQGAEITQWLDENGVKAVIIRPDRYVLGAAANAAELYEISGLLPLA
ncbi:bifunctional 3-(3-hydroxy-phenyl)propionate/3-hydroxycinnamic acid hydroxylase MhpA [Ferviditalea candida]|uniref:Bifunctional 3-(3-hydroxy-phenyl)propionate/3-hydroxycinnamic acid hydroxylase n=1 Tax=Ferviditalea candida TaxID=3108399 RepID=A0ABU5ZC97_9BACL|nr:bifunctional 3-(3-hydroxy-phenyl)propionate/3-hydroxycinnamic acid hydroxylase [Paenibacillaceae bacterium T2]